MRAHVCKSSSGYPVCANRCASRREIAVFSNSGDSTGDSLMGRVYEDQSQRDACLVCAALKYPTFSSGATTDYAIGLCVHDYNVCLRRATSPQAPSAAFLPASLCSKHSAQNRSLVSCDALACTRRGFAVRCLKCQICPNGH